MTLTSTGLRTALVTTREARGHVPGDGITMSWGHWPGSGPTVVGLHGVTASYANFVGVADRLRGRRPLLALDLRGRGDTDKPDAGPFGMAQHAHDRMAAFAQGLRDSAADEAAGTGEQDTHARGSLASGARSRRRPVTL